MAEGGGAVFGKQTNLPIIILIHTGAQRYGVVEVNDQDIILTEEGQAVPDIWLKRNGTFGFDLPGEDLTGLRVGPQAGFVLEPAAARLKEDVIAAREGFVDTQCNADLQRFV